METRGLDATNHVATLDEFLLGCERLELIEAAAWRVLVETVAGTPGASLLLEGVNETVHGAWLLSGYGAAGIAVQVQS